jgi:hypothetical protein
MSREDYFRLPEWPRAEWVDGVAVLMDVPPTPGRWETHLLLDDDTPEGSVEVDGVTIPIDLGRLLRL